MTEINENRFDKASEVRGGVAFEERNRSEENNVKSLEQLNESALRTADGQNKRSLRDRPNGKDDEKTIYPKKTAQSLMMKILQINRKL